MSKLFALAIPIPPNKKEEWKKFITELTGKWQAEFSASRKKPGIHERTFHQQTPMGDFVIVTLEGNDPEKAFQNFITPDDEFTNWFKQQVKDITTLTLRRRKWGRFRS
ncbi:MAG TPA: hypothetical protein VGI82_07310 [Chitinophagaceae bacterium]